MYRPASHANLEPSFAISLQQQTAFLLVQVVCRGAEFRERLLALTDAERALKGTWVMDEVRLAVEKGYKVLEIFEVYEYDVTQYGPQTGRLLCPVHRYLSEVEDGG